ncbi:NDR1/HIN1-like protein 26 [Salvia miltiorrhiza]|uniref:NDR1/HIN1-like protein 26 n=1 Tax=Salvia miltiorrhiza TaxID=226208 RepID=UPI0025AD335F|nr:NDR1/HIN1-like protein 26 [Salvia miltiorrhiza]
MASPSAPAAAAPAATDRAPLSAVYLHQLYREPEPNPQPQPDPEQGLQFVRRELLFFCTILKWCILAFLFIASFLALMWMVFHPTFPQLSIASAILSPIAVTSTAASADCNITLVLTNPNRHLTASYDRMEISLLYASQQVTLSQVHHPRIVQPKRSQITLQTNLSFSAVNLTSGVVSAMKEDLDRGSLGLMMKISSVVKYRNGKWKTKSRFMRAYCGGVSFGFTSSNRPGIFLNPYQECEVYVYSK